MVALIRHPDATAVALLRNVQRKIAKSTSRGNLPPPGFGRPVPRKSEPPGGDSRNPVPTDWSRDHAQTCPTVAAVSAGFSGAGRAHQHSIAINRRIRAFAAI